MAVRYGRNGYVARQYLTAAEDERVREAHIHKGYRRTVNKAGRIYTAVSLRIAEWSLESIGEELGLTPQRVSKICQEYRLAGQNGRLLIVKSLPNNDDGDDYFWRDYVETFPVPHIQDTVPSKNIYGEDIPVPVAVQREYAQVQRVEELTGIANIWPPPEKKPAKSALYEMAQAGIPVGNLGLGGGESDEDRMAVAAARMDAIKADESLTDKERRRQLNRWECEYWAARKGQTQRRGMEHAEHWDLQDDYKDLESECELLRLENAQVAELRRERDKFRVVLQELGIDPDKIPDLPAAD